MDSFCGPHRSEPASKGGTSGQVAERTATRREDVDICRLWACQPPTVSAAVATPRRACRGKDDLTTKSGLRH